MPGLLRKLANLAGRFVREPKAAVASVPSLLESARMRLRRDAIFRREEDLVHASNCPSRMLDRVLELWHPASVLDVGCGTGKAIDHLLSRGVRDLCGLEGSELAISNASHPDLLRRCNLVQPVKLGRSFDLVYSFEVAEHLPPEAADTFVETMTSHGQRVVMTAARPGQGGLGHLNEQEAAYWIEKFERAGFDYDEASTQKLKLVRDLYYDNLMVFTRRPV